MFFALLPSQNKFIAGYSKGVVQGLADSIWFDEIVLYASEQEFQELYASQLQKGQQMREVTCARILKQPGIRV